MGAKMVHFEGTPLLCSLMLFRIFLAVFVVRTYFNPDEFWQSLEVAHRMVFGYGHLTWEWHPDMALRGYAHPLLFAIPFWILKVLHLDSPEMIVVVPRVIQGAMAGLADYYVYGFAKRLFTLESARWTLFCQLSCWFVGYCMVRTFSNSLEALLVVAAFNYWPLDFEAPVKYRTVQHRRIALVLAGLSCVFRPTAAAIWFFMGLRHLRHLHSVSMKEVNRFIVELLVVGISCLTVSAVIDRMFYGRWTFALINFLKFNMLQGGGSFYGTHPWHWYVSQGFPAIIFTAIPILFAGVLATPKKEIFVLAGLCTAVYSMTAHKEFRFLLPLLLLLMPYCGEGLRWIQSKTSKKELNTSSSSSSSSSSRLSVWTVVVCLFLLLSNAAMFVYMSAYHQRAPGRIMQSLRNDFDLIEKHDVKFSPELVPAVHFWSECHATPYYSHLHRNISMSFFDCSPSFEKDHVRDVDLFFRDPKARLAELYPEGSPLPSHIVAWTSVLPEVEEFLVLHDYIPFEEVYHAYVSEGPLGYEKNASFILLRHQSILQQLERSMKKSVE